MRLVYRERQTISHVEGSPGGNEKRHGVDVYFIWICIGFLVNMITAGFDRVKPEAGAHKLTVVGKVDPSKLREQLAGKLKKKVDLISLQPKKEKDYSSNKKQPEKAANDDKKPKEVR